MIWGTSVFCNNLDPETSWFLPTCFKRYKKIWNHHGKILLLSIWDSRNFEKSKMYVLGTIGFFCLFVFLWKLEYIFSKYFCGNEDRQMINFPGVKCTKAWIWISYLSKNTKSKCGSFFYFEVRESLNFFIFKEWSLNFSIFKKGNH